MPDIDKTIEQVKELDKLRSSGDWDYICYKVPDGEALRMDYAVVDGDRKTIFKDIYNLARSRNARFIVASANSIMPIIAAYEQSQKELEEQEKRIIGQFLYLKNLETHFDTANSRIAELEKLLKRVEPSTATTIELYRDITEALYVVKEQTDERR